MAGIGYCRVLRIGPQRHWLFGFEGQEVMRKINTDVANTQIIGRRGWSDSDREDRPGANAPSFEGDSLGRKKPASQSRTWLPFGKGDRCLS